MVEMISTRLPYGAAAIMSKTARELAISRSELLRRAVEAYIATHRQPDERHEAVQ